MATTAKPKDREMTNSLSLIGEGESFKEELYQMLESAQLFSDLSRREIQTLAGYAHAYVVEKGAIIFKEGHKGSFMCIVTDGLVDILKETDARNNKRITTIRPGKTMGEMSILDDLPYSATAVAAEKTKVVLITKSNFDNLTDKFPDLGLRVMRKIAKLLSLRLRQTTGILLDYLE
ncbi:MAG: cyclic nucleotide-binding domain-containing protein [Gammaproteobacteria bacterium]